VIQDKLYLPGFARLLALKRAGFFGRILSLKLESGWWIFDGEQQPCQRPTWSFRTAAGGGMAADMYTHYRYMIDRLAAPVTHIAAMLATHIPSRIDAAGQRYACDADDSAYALLRLEGGAVATIASTWVTRVKRDDLITIQIDGTLGSAVAGGHRCVVQSSVTTPKPTWNTEAPQAMDFNAQWTEVPANEPFRSSFRQTWEAFLRHVAEDAPFVPTLVEGAKAVQLAELAEASHREGRWLAVPPLSL
jgi:predicted dehydrogenase